MTAKEINRRKNGQRALKVRIKIHIISHPLGKPTLSRLKLWPYKIIYIRTYRHNYRKFSFIACEADDQFRILVLKFETGDDSSLSSEMLKKWDPRVSII